MEQFTGTQAGNAAWHKLYKAGGTAPLILLAFYIIQIVAMIAFSARVPYPASAEDWLILFQRHRVLGLLYLNALDIFSIALLGLMYLALYVALQRVDPPAMAIAAFFALIGAPVFIVPRVAMLSVLPLSQKYAAAATQAQQAQILAASEALGSLGYATTETVGFLFLAVAALIISLAMRRSEHFPKATAFLGILASSITFVDHLCLVLAPAVASMLMQVGALVWIAWWLLVSRGLFRLAKSTQIKK